MDWFQLALIPPLVYAAVNHIDKHLLQGYFKGEDIGALALFSALFAVVTLPCIGWFAPGTFSVSFWDAALLIANGVVLVLASICYLYALNRDETSLVIPLFQLIPVIGFIIGYFALGEQLSTAQTIGSTVVIVGAVILSLRLGNSRLEFKGTVLCFMVVSSLLYAGSGVLFKFVTHTQQQFWPALFWEFVGKVVFGLVLFIGVPPYRRQFLAVLRQNKAWILSLNVINESLALLGEGASSFAVLFAPVVLVQVVSGFQPMFVFLYGVLLTLLLPRIAKESLTKKDLAHKCVGIATIIGGTIILNL